MLDLANLEAQCRKVAPDNWLEYYWHVVQANAKTDICAYLLWVHGKDIPVLATLATSRHARVWEQLYSRHLQTLIMCPPEHGKTAFQRAYTEWWLGTQTEAHWEGEDVPVPSCLLVMNAATQAEEQCMVIAATLETNERYRALFPHVEPDVKWGWTKSVLFLKRRTPRPDPSFMATGIFGPIQGKRFGMRGVDDPTDQEDALTGDTVKKQIARHQGVLDDRMLAGAPKRDILTPWSRIGIHSVLKDSPQWKSVTMPAIGYWGEGQALWPEVFPLERLAEKRQEKQLVEGSDLWQLAWMVNPVSAEGNMFQRAWLQYQSSPLEPLAA